jgi:hypothetical protein
MEPILTILPLFQNGEERAGTLQHVPMPAFDMIAAEEFRVKARNVVLTIVPSQVPLCAILSRSATAAPGPRAKAAHAGVMVPHE